MNNTIVGTPITEEITKLKDILIKSTPIEKLYLFGSFAYGMPNEDSDFDFYAVIPNDGIRPLDAMGEMYMSLIGTKRRPIDILAGTREIFERRSKLNTLERKIAREGVVLFDGGE